MLKKELKNEEDFEKKEQLKTALTRLVILIKFALFSNIL